MVSDYKTARIIDPHSKFFGLIVTIVTIHKNTRGQVTQYVVKGASTGELALSPCDVQLYYKKPRKGRGVSTQMELFQETFID